MKGRLLWLDSIKATAIFLVVLLHTTPSLSHQTVWDNLVSLFYQTTRVSISLFVMASGAVLLGKTDPALVFYKKRVKSVVIPWIFWTCLYLTVDMWTFHLGFPASFHAFYRYFFSRLWFLPMIIGLYVLTPLLRIGIQKTKHGLLYFLCLWFVLIILLPSLQFGFALNTITINSVVLQFLGFFVLGYYLVQQKNLKKLPSVFWLFLFVLGIAAGYFEQILLPEISNLRFRSFPYNFISPEYVIAAIGIFMAFYLFLEKKKINKTLEKIVISISKASLGIYVVHQLITEVVFEKLRLSHPFPLLETVLLFVFSYFVVLILGKIKLLWFLAP